MRRSIRQRGSSALCGSALGGRSRLAQVCSVRRHCGTIRLTGRGERLGLVRAGADRAAGREGVPACTAAAEGRSIPGEQTAVRHRGVVIALLITLPFYPLIMLAIWLDDGRPFLFTHRRETVGGKLFPLIKFRSMKKDAELVKVALQQQNHADGPQFYMPGDPRSRASAGC